METATDIISRIRAGGLSTEELEALASTVREKIKADPAKGKEYGPLMGMISQAIRQQEETADINWVAAGKGALAIGHKPGGKISFEGMRNAGVTAVLTLLQGNEGALQIGDKVKKAGMEWIWFPFSAAQDNLLADTQRVFDLYQQLAALLEGSGQIYIHCSAGIHRTGMITYGLLRYLGMDNEAAAIMLRQLREVTAEQVGEERMIWGEQFGK